MAMCRAEPRGLRNRAGRVVLLGAFLGVLRLVATPSFAGALPHLRQSGFLRVGPRDTFYRSRARGTFGTVATEGGCLDERDVDFMDRLQGLAAEVLALPNLTAHQRLVWVTSLRLNAVPVQESCPHGSGSAGTSLAGLQALTC
ncbi:unnamed protein product [Effrenium voratum]|nr:unnamed protein product [Effrenium voratum]